MSSQVVTDGPAPVNENPKPRRLITDAEFRRRLGGISRIGLWRIDQEDPRCPRKVKVRNLNCREEAAANEYIATLIAEGA